MACLRWVCGVGVFFFPEEGGTQCAGCWREGSGGRCHRDRRGLPRSWRERAGPGGAGGERRGGCGRGPARQEGEERQEKKWVRPPLALRSTDRPFPRPPRLPRHPAPGEMAYPCDNLTGCVSIVGRRAAGRTSEFGNVQVPTQSPAERWRGGPGARGCPSWPGGDSQTGGSRCRRPVQVEADSAVEDPSPTGPPAWQCHAALPCGGSRKPRSWVKGGFFTPLGAQTRFLSWAHDF